MTTGAGVAVTPETEKRFQNFLVFEPAAIRINEMDILLKGEEVVKLFRRAQAAIEDKHTLDVMIIQNRLTKIEQMIRLLNSYDELIMTKFYDRIWRRYSNVSNLGEYFLDYKTFLKFYPEFKKKKDTLVTIRIEEEDEFEMDNEVVEVKDAV